MSGSGPGGPGGAGRERVPLSARLSTGRLVAVLRAPTAERYDAVVDVLVEAGVDAVELTLTTPGTVEALPRLLARVGAAAEVGVGTVTTAEQAARALGAGAAFLVTPTVAPDVAQVGVEAGLPVLVGALTPGEIQAAWSCGASAVKVFPASHVGPGYLRAVAGPFPEVAMVPSGGVAVDELPAWLAAGAVALSLGGELLGDALRGGDLRALAARAARCRAVVDEAIGTPGREPAGGSGGTR